MIQAFAFLRVLVMLRRIHKELRVSNEIAKERLHLEQDRLAMDHPSWYKAGGRVPASTKKVEFGVAEVSDWNKRTREVNPYGQTHDEGP